MCLSEGAVGHRGMGVGVARHVGFAGIGPEGWVRALEGKGDVAAPRGHICRDIVPGQAAGVVSDISRQVIFIPCPSKQILS